MLKRKFLNLKKTDFLFYSAVTVFFLITLRLHYRIDLQWKDDIFFSQALNNTSLWPYLVNRYQTWTSRTMIEAVMTPIAAFAPDLWRLSNTGILFLLIWNVNDIWGGKNKKLSFFLFSCLMGLIPLSTLNNAGWMATTTNYLWSLSLGLIAVRPVVHNFSDTKCRIWEYICCPLCIIYAANMELMGAILLGTYLLLGIVLFQEKKKIDAICYVQLGLTILSLVFIFLCPGNSLRRIQEVERFYPGFDNMNIASKFLMGFIDNSHYYLASGHRNMEVCYVMGVFTFIIFLSFFLDIKNRKSEKMLWLKSILVACPFIAYLSFSFWFYYILYVFNFPKFRRLLTVLCENSYIGEKSYFTMPFILFQAFVYLLVFLCIYFSIFILHGFTKETFIQIVILSAGICSRLLMGFSPTIYASGARTAMFCSTALLIVSFRNLVLLWEKNPGILWKLLLGFYVYNLIGLNI